MTAHRLLVVIAFELCLARVAHGGTGQWTNVGLPSNLGGDVGWSLLANPVDPLTLYAWANAGTLKSIDGGETWTQINSSSGALVVDPQEHSVLYLGSFYEGVLTSLDGGGSWSSTVSQPSCRFVAALALDPQNSSRLLAGSANVLHSAEQCGGLFLSADSGLTWRRVSTGYILGVAVDPKNGLNTFAIAFSGSGGRGLIRSVDGGESWTFPSTHLPDPLVVLPHSTENLVYAGTFDGVYVSRDEGTSWQALGLGGIGVRTLAIDPRNPNVLYAGTQGYGVFRGQDGGESWSEFNVGLTNSLVTAIVINSAGTRIYAGTNGGVFDYEFVNRPPVINGSRQRSVRSVETRH